MSPGFVRRWVRRRSSFELAIAVAWLWRAVFGWLITLPVASLVASTGVGALPQADRALFEPGGFWLLETLRVLTAGLGASFGSELVWFSLALAAGALPRALLFTAAAAPEQPPRTASSRALAHAPGFVVLSLVQGAGSVLVLLTAYMAAGAWASAALASASEPLRDVSALAVFGVVLLGAVAVGAVCDAARAHAVHSSASRLLGRLAAGFRSFVRAPLPLVAGYLLFTGAAALLVALVARAVELVDVSRPGGARVLLVLVLHQATLLGLAVCEALWVRRVVAVALPPSRLREARLAQQAPIDLDIPPRGAVPAEVAPHDPAA